MRADDLGYAYVSEYTDLLLKSPFEAPEWQFFVQVIVNHKTSFFRIPEQLEYLVQTWIPNWKKTHKDSVLKIWSAACSTGEEPYSIAMTLNAHFGAKFKFSILATDISPVATARGALGVYPYKQLQEEVPSQYRKKYFQKIRRNKTTIWGQLRSELQEKVTFQTHNLNSKIRPNGASFDVIVCANVLPFFNPDLLHEIMERFYQQTNPGGCLLLDRIDSYDVPVRPFDSYDAFAGKWKIHSAGILTKA